MGLVAYSVAISVAVAADAGSFDLLSVLRPLGVNLLVFCLGGVFGLLLKLFLDGRSADNRLIVSVALLFAFCGICTALDVSPLLGCMAMGMVYINTTGDERLFKQLNYFSPPILLLFFVRSGLNFDLRRAREHLRRHRRRAASSGSAWLTFCAHSRQIRRRVLRLPAHREG